LETNNLVLKSEPYH